MKKKRLDGLVIPVAEYTYHDNGLIDTSKDANLVTTTHNYDPTTFDLVGKTTTAPGSPAMTIAVSNGDRMYHLAGGECTSGR